MPAISRSRLSLPALSRKPASLVGSACSPPIASGFCWDLFRIWIWIGSRSGLDWIWIGLGYNWIGHHWIRSGLDLDTIGLDFGLEYNWIGSGLHLVRI